jgi:flagellar biosynthesis/type III secretory pathway chaperone
MNASIRAHNMIDLLEDLVAVLERENALLETPRAKDLEPVIEEKQALFKLYTDQVGEIARDQGFASALPEDLRDRLTDMANALDDAMKRNKRRLELLTNASKHIVDRITEAARDAAGRVPQYGRAGKLTAYEAAAPVAMNKEV